jgi:hypothetical protein
MRAWQEGRAPEPATEDVWLQEPNPKAGQLIPGTNGQRELPYLPLNLGQLGVGGVRRFLERGNSWGGRVPTLEEQARRAMQANQEMRERHKATLKEENRKEQMDKRRWRFKIPFLRVGVDLQTKKGVVSDAQSAHKD